MKLYQLKVRNLEEVFQPTFFFDEHEVIAETAKTYVIETRGYNEVLKNYHPVKRRILKDPNGKRFAYDTKEGAVNGFLHKRKRYRTILRNQLKRNDLVIEIATKMLTDVDYKHDFGGW